MAKALQVISSVIRFDNSDVADRKYDISANVHVTNGEVGNMENGEVRKGDEVVAIFSTWDDNKSATFYGLTTTEENNVNTNIEDFKVSLSSTQSNVSVE